MKTGTSTCVCLGPLSLGVGAEGRKRESTREPAFLLFTAEAGHHRMLSAPPLLSPNARSSGRSSLGSSGSLRRRSPPPGTPSGATCWAQKLGRRRGMSGPAISSGHPHASEGRRAGAVGSGQEGVDQPPPPGHSAQSAAVWFGGSTIGPPDSKSAISHMVPTLGYDCTEVLSIRERRRKTDNNDNNNVYLALGTCHVPGIGFKTPATSLGTTAAT